MKKEKASVAILMGSASDSSQLKGCAEVLKEFRVPYVAKVLSAHRSPRETVSFVESAKARGIEIIIAAAGGAAHLAGVAAAHTDLPVIGIPVYSKSLKGMDSLLSTVQMPAGVPVACVAVGSSGPQNAAYLAVRILALRDKRLRTLLDKLKASMRKKILKTRLDF